MKQKFKYGPWFVEYSPEDGARLNRLYYDGIDLFTTEPKNFRPPKANFGSYETRKVYGYDDCFPSVDSCIFPESDWYIPDHGELCWLSWETAKKSDCLVFSVQSKVLPLLFKREMCFHESVLIWNFEVKNESERTVPFQHVMHPLMPLHKIKNIELPDFEWVFNEVNQQTLDLKNPDSVRDFLLNQVSGTTNMLMLQKIESGVMAWTFDNGLRIEVRFPIKYFPTIGIWWNNNSYPDEDGCRRNECAFEPIPGSKSILSEAYKDGTCLSVSPGECFSWQIEWKINF